MVWQACACATQGGVIGQIGEAPPVRAGTLLLGFGAQFRVLLSEIVGYARNKMGRGYVEKLSGIVTRMLHSTTVEKSFFPY